MIDWHGYRWRRRGLFRVLTDCRPRQEDSDHERQYEQFNGGCLPDAVRFIATGQPKGIYWCHCQSCRKRAGAPASVCVAFERIAYTVIKGEITSSNLRRGKPGLRQESMRELVLEVYQAPSLSPLPRLIVGEGIQAAPQHLHRTSSRGGSA
jgi:hypothetical protein